MKLHIDKLIRKEVPSKFGGTSTKVSIHSNGVWYSCFARPWTEGVMAGWKEGMEIDVPVVQNGQYWNIEFPKPSGAQGGGWGDEFKKIHEKLDKILSFIQLRELDMEPPVE
jgi:hypothetical protein